MQRPDQTLTAAGAAGCVVAFQVLGKASRDTLFLTTFSAEYLPWMVSGSALLAIPIALFSVRFIALMGPKEITTTLYLTSGVLLALEWLAASAFPVFVPVIVYVHLSAFSSVFVSGFWSTVSECFDPYSAKKSMSRIASGATIGGLIGGLLAERAANYLSPDQSLLAVAAGHLLVSAMCSQLRPLEGRNTDVSKPLPSEAISGVLRERYLINLALLLVFTTASATVLDFVFKAEASRVLSSAELMKCFGLFYTVVGLLTFFVQYLLGRRMLERAGVVLSTVPLPLAGIVGGSAFALFPGLASAALARGATAVIENSLFRSGYELLFGPVDPELRRRTKTLIDVGADRLGDVLGGLLVAATLAAVATPYLPIALGGLAAIMAIGVMGLLFALRVRYIGQLERSIEGQQDQELSALHEGDLLRTLAHMVSPDTNTRLPQPEPVEEQPPTLLDTLCKPELSDLELQKLRQAAQQDVGVFVRILVDSSHAFAARRRVPRVVYECEHPGVTGALLTGLRDTRFAVRFQCGAALFVRQRLRPETFDTTILFEIIEREVSVGRKLWNSRRQLDLEAGALAQASLGTQANSSLQHVCHLLALLHDEKPVRLAFRALQTEDTVLRGTALEYLETILPMRVRDRLWVLLGEDDFQSGAPDQETALHSILQAQSEIG